MPRLEHLALKPSRYLFTLNGGLHFLLAAMLLACALPLWWSLLGLGLLLLSFVFQSLVYYRSCRAPAVLGLRHDGQHWLLQCSKTSCAGAGSPRLASA